MMSMYQDAVLSQLGSEFFPAIFPARERRRLTEYR